MLDQCTSTCGYIAAFASCLCFGSFCVPMKGDAAKSVDVDPLVFQSYKTLLSFLTSFVILFFGEKITFTPWGIVSGLFWVPGGAAHICAVRTAGLAISQGTCSSMIVFVSFSWGIFIFHERVRNIYSACFSIVLMIVGICGMSFFSAPGTASSSLEQQKGGKSKDVELSSSSVVSGKTSEREMLLGNTNDDGVENFSDVSSKGNDMTSMKEGPSMRKTNDDGCSHNDTTSSNIMDEEDPKKSHSIVARTSSFADGSEETAKLIDGTTKEDYDEGKKSMGGMTVLVSSFANSINRKYDLNVTTRQLGVTIAALGGAWGGSVMAPLHFAGDDAKGLSYVFSFAVGALLINTILWILRYLYHLQLTKSFTSAYHALPSFHFQTMAIPGAISGILWSIGNIGSILSVTYLGEGVGYSITQSSMLVGGLWGIFWFHEITSRGAIRGWILSAIVTISGILLLSYNHLSGTAPLILKKT